MPVLGPNAAYTNNTFDDNSPTRNTVHEVVETPILAVKYTDGYGKTQMRLVVMIEDQPFLLHQDVSENARATQNWLAKQILEKLNGPPAPRKKTRKSKGKKAKPAPVEVKAAPPINMDAM